MKKTLIVLLFTFVFTSAYADNWSAWYSLGDKIYYSYRKGSEDNMGYRDFYFRFKNSNSEDNAAFSISIWDTKVFQGTRGYATMDGIVVKPKETVTKNSLGQVLKVKIEGIHEISKRSFRLYR